MSKLHRARWTCRKRSAEQDAVWFLQLMTSHSNLKKPYGWMKTWASLSYNHLSLEINGWQTAEMKRKTDAIVDHQVSWKTSDAPCYLFLFAITLGLTLQMLSFCCFSIFGEMLSVKNCFYFSSLLFCMNVLYVSIFFEAVRCYFMLKIMMCSKY